MEQAWLDSLSEDWISQPRSSGSPSPSLPSTANEVSDSSNVRPTTSLIPRYNPQKKVWTAAGAPPNNNSPLSERSLNDSNIPLSQRAPKHHSKLRDEVPISTDSHGNDSLQSFSETSTRSAHYDTIQHTSVKVSPSKGLNETPEWKSRLLRGDVAYGEQRDLFSPAGLENIFRPPAAQTAAPGKLQRETQPAEEPSVIMPSSPPPYKLNRDLKLGTGASGEGMPQEDGQGCRQPRGIQYKLNAEEGSSGFSTNDLSRSSHFRPNMAGLPASQDEYTIEDTRSNLESSIAQQNGMVEGAGRIVSGQSDVRNEELSPIYISRHNTVDGKMDYTAAVTAAELRQRLEEFRETDAPEITKEDDEASHLILEDVTNDTDDYAHNGRFVNLRRGGRSLEGSFQRRMLSPSSLPAIDESAMLPEESMQASTPKQLPRIKKTRVSKEHRRSPPSPVSSSIPHTPHQSPGKSNEKHHDHSSGSPLKLFGTYDTFTNQTLLRRLSQFEGDLEDNDKGEFQSTSAQEPTNSELNEAFVSASSPHKMEPKRATHKQAPKKFNSFGEGDLDDFQFSEGVSYDSSRLGDQYEDKDKISASVLDRTTPSKFGFQLEPSPALEDGRVASHRTRYTNTTSTTKHTVNIQKTIRHSSDSSELAAEVPPSQRIENLETPRKRNGNSEGKRLPKSPLKVPTPKRRRTLPEDDIGDSEVDEVDHGVESLKETHQQMQSVIGKKRKDARHDDIQRAANPDVLAMRQILRPRTLSSEQKIHQQQDSQPLPELPPTSVQRARSLQQKKIALIQAELDSVETRNAPAAIGAAQRMVDESRKGSVTTQDFLDEAKKIMAGIRGKVRPQSGLASLEESESENDRNRSAVGSAENGVSDDSYQESTQEPFSRPPSRDGGPVSRRPPRQEDPDLLIHLRKYQEKSDIDGVISSLKSMAMSRDATSTVEGVERAAAEGPIASSDRPLTSGEFIESEPPNIRISENLEHQRKRKHSSSSTSVPSGGNDAEDARFVSHGSNASSNQSTSRSIPTGSSRGSNSRHVIAPHTISHLIPEQLAGMVFDRDRNIWVKRKKSVDVGNGSQNFLAMDETEDDPFGDIPDLSVDETQELQRIKAAAAELKQKSQLPQLHHIGMSEMKDPIFKIPIEPGLSEQPSLGHSKLTSHASNHVAHRSDGWESPGSEQASMEHSMEANRETETVSHIQKSNDARMEEEAFEDVEREISILEGRIDPIKSPRRRNITISFSSPLTSVIHPQLYDHENSFERNTVDDNGYDSEEIENEVNDSFVVSMNGRNQRAGSTKVRTASRKSTRHVSLGGHTFSTRPVSRIDEQDENSFDACMDGQRRSVSVVVATPMLRQRSTSVVVATPRLSHEIGTLTLSPLSDFTMHQEDESFGLNVSYVAGGQRYSHGDNAQRALSLAIKELVQKITDVEPYEPFWEHMKQMDLRDKKLHNLHKFDEFCGQLEELDVSHNQISQLDGVSRTVRDIRITHNCLSDLTAWGHLNNLQYIDVSNNQLETLSAFKNLIHLRGLRADNNMIGSLAGIGQLDGLLSLRLRGNLVESIDFKGTKLQRLTDLDLRGNRVCDVRNLNELASISDLDLEDNMLCHFSVDESQPISSLKYLRLSGNHLDHIDLSPYPNLRLIYLDRNCLGTVRGLLKTKRLDSLSMREQKDGAVIDMSFLAEAFEVRKLFLSGNLIHNFEPGVNFLNLQYLELANCGLESLSPEFGQMVLNTRVLNLNFNALRDITPLLGIVRLKKLHLAGNRVSSLRKTTAILSQFLSLTLVDLRANPLTLGFYPPVLETSLVAQKGSGEADIVEPFTIRKGDRAKDMKYAACLDMPTRMLRRVFEMLVLGGCFRLKMLDGLGVDRSILEVKDVVWETLVTSGVLVSNENENEKVEGGDGVNGGVKTPEDNLKGIPEPPESVSKERWPTEDSFA
ncbi:uncharacterized protein BP5553_05940 [Venustampulla echinocandica]|uniref:Leucine-rich repeat and WD repeat-containing protein 1 LRR domain-containing protein n=1 Tax=Venustampulla echinocandica TaxID=2656787 RepID=A0A370TM38_9HELO|nr:uncharacterized protein BP5553_05940 [Venustampulla echinocandica]RDL36588.1 hypothetical protein BP5553_05940 [Venustampulla echinocandica]